MATHREAKNPTFSYVEPLPWPKDVPKVDEVGTTSAPLKSIAFFFGQFCKVYNDDFMQCKNENRDPEHCLLEGRRVTRCAQDLIQKIGEKCGKEWDAHWECLEMNNQNLAKRIPGSPEGKPQIHEKENPVISRLQK
ncbi:ndufa8, NADH-ubiquinone oxidoreductase complex I 19kd subunit [Malassezia caprae]|uniref:Ndufa8, NADH-ubiquinone oxidoreductase complex I 19kd subunit n=1 Tax=Malassezia caprae TaxID=1381934 RepID=A0AAF0IUL8_9BASI|nr:ndufa8, NADH-ubiquinone oxidoreductase complex I 19kd subunit [Malassezia caprae]